MPDEIFRHYQDIDEGARVSSGLGRLELVRTQEVLLRHLPTEPLRILDVGGATGVHASWLAAEGHNVHVVDLMPHHVQQAAALSGSRGRVTAEVGDARHLSAEDSSFDVVLLFGPLYHLTDRQDRLRVWAEARRVLRPDGYVFAAGISRFASLFDGLAREFLFDPQFRPIAERDLQDGQHRNPTEDPRWFTTAYLHLPNEFCDEAEDAGFHVVELVGVEGLAGWLPQLEERWTTREGQEAILFAARAVESEPSLLGLSAHLLLVAR
jgi:SAM-dependent methyltransferase